MKYPAYMIEYRHPQSGKQEHMVVLGDGSVDPVAKAAKHHGVLEPLVYERDYQTALSRIAELETLLGAQAK